MWHREVKQFRVTSKVTYVLILILAVAMFFPALGSFGFMDPSDGLYAEGAREMLESGDFLTPHINYVPFLEKPVLVYWLIAGCFKLIGNTEFAARMPAALSALETSLVVALISGRFLPRRATLLSSLVLISNLLFAVVGHLALTDMELTCLSTSASLSLFHALNYENDRRRLFLTVAYISLGLTMLLKGPIIIILTTVLFAVYGLLRNKLWPDKAASILRFVRPLDLPFGMIIVTVISAPWFIAENLKTGGAFFTEFVVHQNLGRITGTVNHIEPWWFYIPILFVIFLPWTFLAPYALALRRVFSMRKEVPTMRIKMMLFGLTGAIVYFLFFSIIKTKLPSYILPGVPFACIFIGATLDTCARIRSKWSRRYTITGMISVCTVSMLAFLAILYLSSKYGAPSRTIMTLYCGASIVFVIGFVLLLMQNREKPERFNPIGLALLWYCSLLLVVPGSLLYFYQLKQADFRRMVAAARGANLATFWRDTTAGIFYHQKKVTLVMTIEDLEKFLHTDGCPHEIIVTEDLIPFLRLEAKRPNLNPVTSSGRYYLFVLD
jgi:4-amino-4-deoxy-L-arabinose transferase-like glycosyltransferase